MVAGILKKKKKTNANGAASNTTKGINGKQVPIKCCKTAYQTRFSCLPY